MHTYTSTSDGILLSWFGGGALLNYGITHDDNDVLDLMHNPSAFEGAGRYSNPILQA